MSGSGAMHSEMPGMFPGRPGGVRDEPLLDMLMERRPIPPGAPLQMHDVARMLAVAAGPAEPGELAGEVAALAAFARQASPAGISPAAQRPARHRLSRRQARGSLPRTAALAVAAAGLGSIVAAYLGVLPGPIQQAAHDAVGAPAASSNPARSSGAALQSSGHHRHGASGQPQASPAGPARSHDGGTGQQPHSRPPRRGSVPAANCTPRPGQVQGQPTPRPTPSATGYPGWMPQSPPPTVCLVVTPTPRPGR